jgi:clan AA aspartic protease
LFLRKRQELQETALRSTITGEPSTGVVTMGYIHAEITLTNDGDTAVASRGYMKPEEIRSVTVSALVDSGAHRLVINEEIQKQLGLREIKSMSAMLADGTVKEFAIAEGVEIRFKNRSTICFPVVVPGNAQVLLGAIPLQDLDVVLNMKAEELQINPEHPAPVTMLL